MERRPITNGERIAARIDVRGECWIWTGNLATNGYPVLASTTEVTSIIPLLWKQEHGPVPDGHVLTCSHPVAEPDVCVNPAHYVARPSGFHLIPKCRNGHDLTDQSNIWTSASGVRRCVKCMIRNGKGVPGTTRRRSPS